MERERVELPGSRPVHAEGSGPGEPAPAGTRLTVSVLIRRTPSSGVDSETVGEVRSARGAGPADLRLVSQFVREAGLDLEEVDAARRTSRASGTVAQLERGFGVHLRSLGPGPTSGSTYDGPILLPRDLAGVVVGVLGLDQRAVSRR